MNGKKEGRGIEAFAEGNRYEGEYCNDRFEGQGEYTWAAGEKKGDHYVGEWRRGKPYGQGVYTFANGTKYIGHFMKG